jgi:hypothetical protein
MRLWRGKTDMLTFECKRPRKKTKPRQKIEPQRNFRTLPEGFATKKIPVGLNSLRTKQREGFPAQDEASALVQGEETFRLIQALE